MKLQNTFQFAAATVVILLLSACNRNDQIVKTSLSDDFIITRETPWENTIAVLSPGENSLAPNGKIVLSGGQNAHLMYSRELFRAGTSEINITDIARAVNLPNPPTPDTPVTSEGTDNQIIKLADGSLLEFRAACIWTPLANPPDWDSEKLICGCDGFHQRNRGCINIYLSTDGGLTWAPHDTIDFGSEQFREYGRPRPLKLDVNNPKNRNAYKPDVSVSDQSKDASGQKYWWLGGIDRPEVYRCPFTGNIYLTARAGGGIKDSANYRDTYILLVSTDNGSNWSLVTDKIPACEPLVMTSTMDGKLFLYQQISTTPTLYYTLLDPDRKIILSHPYSVYYSENRNGTVVEQPASTKLPDFTRINRLAVPTPSICRASESTDVDAVDIAYQVNSGDSCNCNKYYGLVYVQLHDNFSDLPPALVIPFAKVRPPDSTNYSAMHGTFVQPDFVHMPTSIHSSMSMFYWIEMPIQTTNQASIKGILIKGMNVGDPFPLSTKNGLLRNISNPVNIGDYMKGAFFWYNNEYHYVAQWVEPDGIHCNIINANPELVPGKKPNVGSPNVPN